MSWEEGIQKRAKSRLRTNEDLLKLKGFLEEKDAKLALYEFLRGNVTFAAHLFFGVELLPFQHIAVKAMMESDNTLGILGRGSGKCVAINSLCWTKDGLKKAIDINIGDYVQSQYGFNKVEGKTINPIDTTYKLTTSKGFSCEGLDYHRVLTLNKDLDFEWRFSKDLIEGDVLVMRKNCEFPDQSDIFGWSNLDTKANKININGAKTEDWYYFFGLLLGDGYFNKNIVQIVTSDLEIVDFMRQFSKKIGLNLNIDKKEENCYYRLNLNSTNLINYLGFLGFNMEDKAFKKHIPEKILKASENNICQLLKGLFDTDGCCYLNINKSKNMERVRISFSSSSKIMTNQVQNILLQLGIESSTRLKLKKGLVKINKKLCNCQNNYEIEVSAQQNIVIFAQKIGFNILKKSKNLNKIFDYKYQNNEFSSYVPFVGEFFKKEMNKSSILIDGKKYVFRRLTSKKWISEVFQSDKLSQYKEKLYKLLDNNLFFDKVKKIELSKFATIDLQVENEHNYVSNGIINHNSWVTAVYAGLDAILNQGITIGILAGGFRQSKLLLKKLEDIRNSPSAVLFRQCSSPIKRSTDEWSMTIGKSTVLALPLGSGEKLRGFRFQRIIADELLTMPEKIFNEVIGPFLSSNTNPTERKNRYEIETKLIQQGLMKEEDRYVWPSNKLVGLSSASYKFEYLYKLYAQYCHAILHGLKDNDNDKSIKSVIHMSYEAVPQHIYDQNQLSQQKNTMSDSQFNREYRSIFTDDSSGYFNMEQMHKCTIPEGESPCVEVAGEPDSEYILAIDPSWSQNEGSDDFAIQMLKINKESQKSTLVHSYALSGTPLKSHIKYLAYCLENFNVVAICGDYNGGVQFLQSCNESEIFAEKKLKLETIDVAFENPELYQDDLKEFKKQYNKTSKRIVYLRKPTSKWIREANELLQGNINHRRIFFAAAAMDENFGKQINKRIPIDEIQFLRKDEEDILGDTSENGKMVDFVEHQYEMIKMTKNQCALIQITQTAQGTQTFDLPSNLKKTTGRDKARKDSYSALVLGNWMAKVYYDAQNKQVENVITSITPQFIC